MKNKHPYPKIEGNLPKSKPTKNKKVKNKRVRVKHVWKFWKWIFRL